MKTDAVIDGEYRYALFRTWDEDLPKVTWIMLNPSTADATRDDPTIRRCISFSMGWGAGGIIVVNQFALRATSPRALLNHPDPRGPANEAIVNDAINDGTMAVAAWGAFEVPGQPRMVLDHWVLHCLGTTKNGSPKHPLYVPAATELEVFA